MVASDTTVTPSPRESWFYGFETLFSEDPVIFRFEGQSVDEMLVEANILPKEGLPLLVTLNGNELDHTLWESTYPSPGDFVIASPRPEWGVALAIFGLSAKGAFAAAPVWVQAAVVITAAAIYVGASYALSAISQAIAGSPKQNQNTFTDPNGSPTIQGARNQAYRGGPAWQVFGEHRITPPLAALPYTELSGEDSYFRMMFDCGEAPASIGGISIGTTAISTFSDIDFAIHESGGPLAARLYAGDVFEEAPAGLQFRPEMGPPDNRDKPGGWKTFQFSQIGDEFSLDIEFPNGLRTIGEAGKEITRNVELQIQARPVGEVTWTNLPDHAGQFDPLGAEFQISKRSGLRIFEVDREDPDDNTITTLQLSGFLAFRFELNISFKAWAGKGAYEIRMTEIPFGSFDRRLLISDFAAGRGGTGGVALAADDFDVIRARSILYGDVVKETDRAILELRIRATDQLNGVLDNLNVLVTHHVEVFDTGSQTWLPPQPSRNPAWHACHVLRKHENIPDDRIDANEFARLADLCEPTPDNYVRPHDRVFDFDTDAETAVNDILAAGYASLGRKDGGVFYPIIEERKTVPVQAITPRNSSDFRFTRETLPRPHAIRCRFINRDSSGDAWVNDELVVYDTGYGIQDAVSITHSPVLTVADQRSTRSDIDGSYLDDGFQPNTWVSISSFALSNAAWSDRTKDSGYALVKSVSETFIEFYEGTILQDSVGAVAGCVYQTQEATKIETMETPGVTDIRSVWRLGRKPFLFNQARSLLRTVEMSWEHLIAKRGEMVYWSDWVLDETDSRRWGKLINEYPGAAFVDRIDTDETLVYETGKVYGVIARLPDGSVVGPFLCANLFDADGISEADYMKPVVVNGLFQVDDSNHPLFIFGELLDTHEEVLIVEKQPRGDTKALVSVVASAGDVVDVWLNEPVVTTSVAPAQTPFMESELAPPINVKFGVVPLEDRLLVDGTTVLEEPVTGAIPQRILPGIDRRFALSGSWSVDSTGTRNGSAVVPSYEVEYRLTGGDYPAGWRRLDTNIQSMNSYSWIRDIVFAPGATTTVTVDARVRAKGPLGTVSPWVEVLGIPYRDSDLPPIRDLQVRFASRVTTNGVQKNAIIGWAPDVAYQEYIVRVESDDRVIYDAIVGGRFANLTDSSRGIWTVYVSGLATEASTDPTKADSHIAGRMGPAASLEFDFNPGVFAADIPIPSGVRLEGRPLGDSTETRRDFRIVWDPVSLVGSSLDGGAILDSSPASISGVEGYQVVVYDRRDSNKRLRSEEVPASASPSFVYSLEANTEDGRGTPARFVSFEISARVAGVLGRPVRFSPSQLAPNLPTIVDTETSSAGLTIQLDYTRVVDPNVNQLVVWGREGSTDLTNNDLQPDNEVYRGPPSSQITFMPDVTEGKFRYALTDSFSDDPSELVISDNLDLVNTETGVGSATQIFTVFAPTSTGTGHPPAEYWRTGSIGLSSEDEILVEIPIPIAGIGARDATIDFDVDIGAGSNPTFAIYRREEIVVWSVQDYAVANDFRRFTLENSRYEDGEFTASTHGMIATYIVGGATSGFTEWIPIVNDTAATFIADPQTLVLNSTPTVAGPGMGLVGMTVWVYKLITTNLPVRTAGSIAAGVDGVDPFVHVPSVGGPWSSNYQLVRYAQTNTITNIDGRAIVFRK